jgi:hypothetical protein
MAMRDRRFIREHRGGTLTLMQHRLLMRWAILCAWHALRFLKKKPDRRILLALKTAKKWEQGEATVGEARKAAVDMLQLARELKDPAAIAVVRGVGHAVATAHMADHALGPAIYAIKALQAAGKPQLNAQKEHAWQIKHLPRGIKGLVSEELDRKLGKTGREKIRY